MSASDGLNGFHAVAFSAVSLEQSREAVERLLADILKVSQEAALHQPQVHLIAPEKNSISRKQVTNVLHELSLTGAGGDARYVVIEHAHELTPEAANALLKSLEEPPAGVRFYLTTPSAARLLPTIRSRVIIRSLTAEEQAVSGEIATRVGQFIDGSIPERFVLIAELHATGELEQFVTECTDVLRQRHEYGILAWMQDHRLSKSAPNQRLFLEALATSEIIG